MRILVTGGAGFIGSHLADAFLADGHEIAVLDNLHGGLAERVPAGVRFFQTDLRDAEAVAAACREFRPETVAHYAAQMDVRRSRADPAHDAAVNVVGALNVLLAAHAAGAGRFLFASSGGAIAGDNPRLPLAEDVQARPLSPYGVTKGAFEDYLRIWQRVHGMATVILRFANVYGPRQGATGDAGVVAIFAKALWRGEAPTIYGDGTSARDYVFVGDVVAANRAALTVPVGSRRGGETLNVGTGTLTTVRQVFDTVRAAVAEATDRREDELPAARFSPARAGEVYQSCLDPRRAREVLGWKPATGFRAGIRATVEAMKAEGRKP